MQARVQAIAFVLFLASLSTAVAFGQQATGNIVGTVVDPSGAPTAGAAVRVVNELTGEKHNTRTNPTGDYVFPGLAPGLYRIEIEVTGFKKFVRQAMPLNVAQNARADAKLELGQVTQEVVVTGNASLVETREVQVGGLVDDKRIVDLPLNGRNVFSLVTLLPGVTGATEDTLPQQTDVTEGTRFNVNGARVLQTTFLLDGGLNNTVQRNGGMMAPNPDAVAEFRLITSNFNAEYGRSAGGVVTVVTKSGTNQLHGSLWEFLRNDDLDARSFFNPSVEVQKRNMFGGTVSGPVIHDKLFYFFSYQGDRYNQGFFVNTARTPTLAQRGGDFSALPTAQQPLDPLTRQAFPGGIIPTSRLDPVAQNILKLIPLPNTPDGRVQAARTQINNNDQYFGKADYQATSNHRASLGLFFIRSSSYYPFTNNSTISNIPDYAPATDNPNQTNITLNETWTARPNLLNQFTFAYAYGLGTLTPVNRLSWGDFGSRFVPGLQPAYPPRFTVSGGWNGGYNGENIHTDSIYSWGDTVTWIRGAHSLRLGGSLNYLREDYDDRARIGGILNITNTVTNNSFANFELGRADTMQVANGNNVHLRSKNWAGFFQDDFKLSRKVTLNLGVRYEIFTPFTETTNRLATFRPGQQSTVYPTAPTGLVYPSDQGIQKGIIPTDYNNFGPRFGIAIDPFGDGKTAIRAGYGLFYTVGYAGFFQMCSNGQPFADNITINATPSFVNPFGNQPGGNPFPVPAGQTTFINPIAATWMDQNQHTPYVHQFNFTIQRQLVRDLSLEVAYVGNLSRKLFVQTDFNQPAPGAGTVDSRRPYSPGVFGLIALNQTSGNANYNALQATLRRRFSRGFTVLANYAYSKAIDSLSSDAQSSGGILFVDSHNTSLDRSVSGSDRRHVLNMSFLWEPPKIQRFGFVGKQVFSGWQVNAIGHYSSGEPANILSGSDSNQNGLSNTDRPDLVGDPFLDTGRSKDAKLAAYFNTAAFKAAAVGKNGTTGRYILYGPGSQTWDVSFFKMIPIYERHQLQFRSEFFNFFNHANFGNPVNTLTNRNFGQILTAGRGRVIQFGLKYMF